MYAVGSQIVHPLHGAGVIEEIIAQRVDGQRKQYYRLRLSENRMVVMVPVEGAEKIGIRPISTPGKFLEVMEVFDSAPVEINRNWNARYHENLLRIKSGELCEVARVIKSLAYMEITKGLASGERKMLYNAKRILFSEMALIVNQSLEEIEAKVNRLIAGKGE